VNITLLDLMSGLGMCGVLLQCLLYAFMAWTRGQGRYTQMTCAVVLPSCLPSQGLNVGLCEEGRSRSLRCTWDHSPTRSSVRFELKNVFCNDTNSQIACQLSDKWLCRRTRFELQTSQNGSHDLSGIGFSAPLFAFRNLISFSVSPVFRSFHDG
jgi:hypothetical protein